MLRRFRRLPVLALVYLLMITGVPAQVATTANAAKEKAAPSPDLTKEPTLYVIAYAHLDTQWRWEFPQTISQYLANTLHYNFDLFEKYPHYVFNFTGANRYHLMKEYFPADYEKMKQYIAAGRWFPAGSSMEEGDVNAPSAEAIIRQILYGNEYFRHEFGKASAEYMLPDCFGFPASLPSILAHAGIKGFSTQKLSAAWQPAARVGGEGSPEHTPAGIPFNVGIWEGPDGKTIIAALNPGSYSGNVTYDLSKSPATTDPNVRNPPIDWVKRVELNGEVAGLFTDYHYYGTGDVGGSPREPSVKLMEAILTKAMATMPGPPDPNRPPGQATESGPMIKVGDGPLHVVQTTADQMFRDIKPEQAARLPRYKGELELINHSAGSLSSETYQKRWNRQNELLADAAEKASIAADWLGGRPYPQQRLNEAWRLVMGGHFHDTMAGTATPKAYEFAWNDDVLAMNQFAGVLTDATESIASGMNTQAKGAAIVVYNPLNIAREDVVEASVALPNGTKAVRVIGPDGREVPAQIDGWENGAAKVLFVAKAPSVGYAVYDVQAADTVTSASPLRVTESSLENARYSIKVDQSGDVSSIYDKSLNKELLSAPLRLAFQTEKPRDWPAWNMDWADQQKPPRAYVQGPTKVRIVENGPVRVSLAVERESEGSKFVQTVRLSAGDGGNRVEFGNVIDWKTGEAALKATFPLSAANPEATYNWDIGTIKRANNDERKFEVASHQWIDLTDKSGAYGVTVLTDSKNGSDKPDDNTLRLTLIYTPGLGTGNGRAYADQITQDWGHHEFTYGLAGHAGDYREGQTDWQALRLNQPLVAFQSPTHQGPLGKNFSILNVNNSRVRVLAVKRAEESDEVIVRLVEINGSAAKNVHVAFGGPIASAREVNGQEQPVGPATLSKGELVTDFTPYQPRTFALKLGVPPAKLTAPKSQPITLTYDQAVSSDDGAKTAGGFDSAGKAIPAELLPREIAYSGVRFNLAPATGGQPNAMVARGQTISLPPGKFNRVYVLAAADGDQTATFKIGGNPVDLTIQDWSGFIGQWDDRQWKTREEPVPQRAGAPAPAPGTPPRMRTIQYGEMIGIKPGFIKRAPVAWFASHNHTAAGVNVPYSYSYLFAYAIDVPAGATTLTLPNNDKVRIMAITAAEESGRIWPVQPLYDTLVRHEQ